ncbi:MAG: HEAT repeat domain-containing protein [Gemmataceae bacterium]
MRYRWLPILIVLPFLAEPAQAGIFSRKKDKPDPKSRVPELIATLRGDGDADKRAHAAEELRSYDAAAHPEIVPALIEALLGDKKPNVRAEAAQSLGKVRPVTQPAGEALEQAMAGDSSYRVRLQARSSLLGLHWAGYRSGKKTDVPPLTPTTKEPPAVSTTNPPPAPPSRLVPAKVPPRPAVSPPTTKEPPLAPAGPALPPATPPASERPGTALTATTPARCRRGRPPPPRRSPGLF